MALELSSISKRWVQTVLHLVTSPRYTLSYIQIYREPATSLYTVEMEQNSPRFHSST